ncbi:sodium:proton exchanger [Candidatus Epulonipiscium fishelsonii]|uniref:Sodium:proton exchanger n=1 Tax=Candidatus Epulonipiscium fishelsonii TaxID=77094 RepID=A0ACC8X845_9FIRM|nr:sodium:proton exchanger [Epulopiscium sp. SCG-B11WGA-EpuloA1]ONI43088.1 sodium:proton exchanger [Epulopiscium sp. SCG-B05WGA-EpuloA1]
MEYILLLVGFILLIKGADFFVEGASSIAATLRVPSLIIGLTIVAFGTSAPELAVSVTSALSGANAIAVGNVIGSNIFNILMVVGISAIIFPLKVEKSILLKEFPFTLMGTAVLLILSYDTKLNGTNIDVISKSDGWILLIFFGIFLYYLVESALTARKNSQPEDEIETMSMAKSVIMSIGGIIGIVLGGDVVVENATIIALKLGMTEGLVGLTIVAIGTSLPELVTSVVAAKKGESDIALGNVMGSNIFNMFLILGVSTVINPIPVTHEVFIDIIFMGITVLVAFIFAATKRTIGKVEGSIFVISYIAYMAYIIMR